MHFKVNSDQFANFFLKSNFWAQSSSFGILNFDLRRYIHFPDHHALVTDMTWVKQEVYSFCQTRFDIAKHNLRKDREYIGRNGITIIKKKMGKLVQSELQWTKKKNKKKNLLSLKNVEKKWLELFVHWNSHPLIKWLTFCFSVHNYSSWKQWMGTAVNTQTQKSILLCLCVYSCCLQY